MLTCCNHCLKSNKGLFITVFFCQYSQKVPTPVLAFKSFQLICNTLIPISAIVFPHLASKPDYEVYNVSLTDIKQALNYKVKTDLATALLEAYEEFLKVFNQKKVNTLLPHYPRVDHNIQIQLSI